MLTNFSFINKNEYLTVKFSGKLFIKIKKEILIVFLKDIFNISFDNIFKAKKEERKFKDKLIYVSDNDYYKAYHLKKLMVIVNKKLIVKFLNKYFCENDDDKIKTKQFIKFYLKEYKKVTKRKYLPDYETNPKYFDYFYKAVELINKHNVTFKIFIDSQVDGMKFIKQRNFFPKPYNLCTNESELRLLDFLDRSTNVKDDFVPEKSFSLQDIKLETNKKYKKYLELVRKKEADYEQTNYVFSLQVSCLSEVDDFVREYYKSF